jgi:hypothetical protein
MRDDLAYAIAFGVVGLSLGLGCSGKNNAADAKMVDGKSIDASIGEGPGGLPTYFSWEGGEIRLEWIQDGGSNTSRGTAFFYQSETPPTNPIPNFPGCIDARSRDTWPLAQGTIVPLDVGDVVVTTSGGQIPFVKDATGLDQTTACSPTTACPAGDTCMLDGAPTTGAGFCATQDFLQRPHDLWYLKAPTFAANDGARFPANESYDISFTGNFAYTSTGGVAMPAWPAQAYNNVGSNEESSFMPSDWVPTAPAPCTGAAPNQCGAGVPSIAIPNGADFVMGFALDASTDLPPPPYEQVNTALEFDGSGFNGPVVLCQFDGAPTSVTIPAALVTILSAYSPGTVSRQHFTHHIIPLTDGQLDGFGEIIPGTPSKPIPLAEQQRVDLITEWSYIDPWSIQ